jgi:hypothetical protein
MRLRFSLPKPQSLRLDSSNPEIIKPMKNQPKITVGIMDRQTEVFGRLDGNFNGDGFGPVSGWFSAKADAGMIVLTDEAHREIARSPSIRLTAPKDSTLRLRQTPLFKAGTKARSGSTFTLFNVAIRNRFHWERKEDQTFHGDLILQARKDGTIAAINEIPLEDYLTSVISSEMSGAAPMEFLKTHAILSRSWLLAALDRCLFIFYHRLHPVGQRSPHLLHGSIPQFSLSSPIALQLHPIPGRKCLGHGSGRGDRSVPVLP